MAPRVRFGAESAFVLGGLAVIAVGWVTDLLTAIAAGSHAEHAATSTFFSRMNFVFLGVGLAAIGVAYEHHANLLRDPTLTLRYFAGYLIFIDGVLHLFAFNDHLEHAIQAAFFAVVAVTQMILGLALPRLPARFDVAWIVLLVFLFAAFIVTRTMAVWPSGEIEAVDSLGIVSKVIEVVAIVSLVALVRQARPGSVAPIASPSGRA